MPLVDIIEGNAVKRAYQRALLCLHPDKLQQKGAVFHQKYIAEKVFDSLQVVPIKVSLQIIIVYFLITGMAQLACLLCYYNEREIRVQMNLPWPL